MATIPLTNGLYHLHEPVQNATMQTYHWCNWILIKHIRNSAILLMQLLSTVQNQQQKDTCDRTRPKLL